jgi:protoporphyrinogen oxidase
VAVVGGGISGLACAYFLARAGVTVSLLEGSDRFGGLGATFAFGDTHLECFYHCLLPSDQDLLALLAEVGLSAEVYWRETSLGVYAGGYLYPFDTPLDLLRFRSLTVGDRLRVAATGVRARLASARGLDDVTCATWLRRLSGPRAFEQLWRPLLEAKFGERYPEIPALWFWTRFNREKGRGRERKGYVRGGYRRITDCLVAALEALPVGLRSSARVTALDLDEAGRPRLYTPTAGWETFDRLVFAAPLPLLRGVVGAGRLGEWLPRLGPEVDMVGVQNAVFVLARGLGPHYWVAVTDRELPFQGVVESTNLVRRQDIGGVHLVYALRYLHRHDPELSRPEDETLQGSWQGLRSLYPSLADQDVLARHVFRAPFVEPVYRVGYLRERPPEELVPGRVYLATTAQVYPEVTSWNASVALARRVTDRMIHGQHSAR